MKEKLAIFDVDGTLFEGNLGIEFLKSLLKANVFPTNIGQEILGWYAKYKAGEVEKSLAVDEIYRLYAMGMKGVTKEISVKISEETFNNVSKDIYPFATKLIDLLQKAD